MDVAYTFINTDNSPKINVTLVIIKGLFQIQLKSELLARLFFYFLLTYFSFISENVIHKSLDTVWNVLSSRWNDVIICNVYCCILQETSLNFKNSGQYKTLGMLILHFKHRPMRPMNVQTAGHYRKINNHGVIREWTDLVSS